MVLGFDFDRLRSGPFEGPAIVKPPTLPGDAYFLILLRERFFQIHNTFRDTNAAEVKSKVAWEISSKKK